MDQITTDIASKFAVNAFTEIFKSCYQGIKKAGQWIGDENKEHDFFGLAAGRYVNKLQERYDVIRIFGMTEPIKLRSIYTRVNVLKKISSRQRETIEDLAKFFDYDKRGFGEQIETRTGIEIVNEQSKIILLGKPGAGKTTFLKYIALQAIDGELSKERIPVFVSLKDLSDRGLSLINFIVEQFDICNFPTALPFIERVLENGKCILLFDGLDEVPKSKEDYIVSQIRDFTDKYSRNQFILSCRIAAYNYTFEKFTDVEMADFDDDQIKNFIDNWFNSDTNTAKICWSKMKMAPPIKELARIPLLLTLLCLAFDETLGFPANRSELYKEAIDALLKRWDSTRRIKRSEIYEHLSLHKKENMFSRIAAATFEKDQYFLSQKVLTGHISDFIKNLPEFSEASLEIDSEMVLKSIEAQHGIFVERARGIFSFSHLTFQEYFTAKYIVDNATKGTVERLVENCLTNTKWREVFLITAGMLKEADDFLLLIEKKITFLLGIKSSRILGIAMDPSTIQEGANGEELLLVSRRALILREIFTRAEALTKDRVNKSNMIALNETARSLADQVHTALYNDINLNLSFDLSTRFFSDINYAVYRTHDASNKLANIFDYDLAVEFNDYLYVNHLLVECLNTGCFISKETRHTILQNLLTLK